MVARESIPSAMEGRPSVPDTPSARQPVFFFFFKFLYLFISYHLAKTASFFVPLSLFYFVFFLILKDRICPLCGTLIPACASERQGTPLQKSNTYGGANEILEHFT